MSLLTRTLSSQLLFTSCQAMMTPHSYTLTRFAPLPPVLFFFPSRGRNAGRERADEGEGEGKGTRTRDR